MAFVGFGRSLFFIIDNPYQMGKLIVKELHFGRISVFARKGFALWLYYRQLCNGRI